MLLERLRRCPELLLPLGHDPARNHRVHPDPVLAKVARHGTGQAMDGGLCGGVGGEAALCLPPAVGAEIDDRAATGRDHARRHGLDCKEHMANIGGLPFVPIFRSDILPFVAVVTRGVVGEHGRRALTLSQRCDSGAQGLDITQVAQLVIDGAVGAVLERGGTLGIPVEKADLRALRGEGGDGGGPDTGRTARHNHTLTLEARISGKFGHACLSPKSVAWPAKSRPKSNPVVMPSCSVAVDCLLAHPAAFPDSFCWRMMKRRIACSDN